MLPSSAALNLRPGLSLKSQLVKKIEVAEFLRHLDKRETTKWRVALEVKPCRDLNHTRVAAQHLTGLQEVRREWEDLI